MRVAILGAGSVRCSPAVIGSLATYFGERPLHLRMFDADLERLDLFDRLARFCFTATHNAHSLLSTMDAAEAMEGANRLILHVGENCARKYLRERHRMGIAALGAEAMIEQALEEMLAMMPAGAEVLNLQRTGVTVPLERYYRLPWPDEPTAEERMAMPHLVMRWVRGEEYTYEFLRLHERSPLKAWLDDVNSAEQVSSLAVGE